MSNDDIFKNRADLETRLEELRLAREQMEVERQLKMKEEIDLMEGFYRASIKQAEKVLNSIKVGEIIHVDDYGKRLFEIVEKSNSMNVKVRDIKTGQILPIYANQIQKIDKKPEMLEILYENDKKD